MVIGSEFDGFAALCTLVQLGMFDLKGGRLFLKPQAVQDR